MTFSLGRGKFVLDVSGRRTLLIVKLCKRTTSLFLSYYLSLQLRAALDPDRLGPETSGIPVHGSYTAPSLQTTQTFQAKV